MNKNAAIKRILLLLGLAMGGVPGCFGASDENEVSTHQEALTDCDEQTDGYGSHASSEEVACGDADLAAAEKCASAAAEITEHELTFIADHWECYANGSCRCPDYPWCQDNG